MEPKEAEPSRAAKRKEKRKATTEEEEGKGGTSKPKTPRAQPKTPHAQPKKPRAQPKNSKKTPAIAPQSTEAVSQPAAVPSSIAPRQEPTPALPQVAGPSSIAPRQKPTPALPQSPKTIQDLPLTLYELGAALPGYTEPPIDAEDGDLEAEIALMCLSDQPDFIKFLTSSMQVLDTHRNSISQQEHPDIWAQMETRDKFIRWYLQHYQVLGAVAPMATYAAAPEADAFHWQQFDGMDVDLPQEPVALGKS